MKLSRVYYRMVCAAYIYTVMHRYRRFAVRALHRFWSVDGTEPGANSGSRCVGGARDGQSGAFRLCQTRLLRSICSLNRFGGISPSPLTCPCTSLRFPLRTHTFCKRWVRQRRPPYRPPRAALSSTTQYQHSVRCRTQPPQAPPPSAPSTTMPHPRATNVSQRAPLITVAEPS